MESSFRCSPEVGGDKGQVSGEELSSSSWSSAEVKVTCTAGTVTFLELPLRRRPNFKERPRFSKWPGDSNSLDTWQWSLLSLLPWWNALRKVRLNQEELFPADPVDLDLPTTIHNQYTIHRYDNSEGSEYCIMRPTWIIPFTMLHDMQYTHWWWAYGGFKRIHAPRQKKLRSSDWPDAAFSIVFLWFLDLEALLWIRRKGDQTSSYDSAPMLSSMLHGRSNEFLNGLCAHVTSAITGPLGRIVTTSEIPSCGTSTCKIHHDGDAALIWMQCCTLFENQPKCLILHHLLSY